MQATTATPAGRQRQRAAEGLGVTLVVLQELVGLGHDG